MADPSVWNSLVGVNSFRQSLKMFKNSFRQSLKMFLFATYSAHWRFHDDALYKSIFYVLTSEESDNEGGLIFLK